MKSTRFAAFTLVEILVTIGIVAVLATLITGASSSMMARSKMAKSVSNLRQIVAAMHGYASDNDELFPRGYFYKAGQGEVSYVTELVPYLSEKPSPTLPSRNIFISPTSVLPVPEKAADAFIPMTYSVHGVLCPDTSNDQPRIRSNRVARPSQVILIGDGAQNPTSKNAQCGFKSPTAFYQEGSNLPLTDAIPVGADSDTAAGLGQLRYRANGSVTVGMVDGHVETIKKGAVTYANIVADR